MLRLIQFVLFLYRYIILLLLYGHSEFDALFVIYILRNILTLLESWS